MSGLGTILVAAGVALWGLPLASRLVGLAPYRVGWVMYLANVLFELGEKRLRVSRWWLEACLVAVAVGLVAAGLRSAVAPALMLALHLVLVLENLLRERGIVNCVYAQPEQVGLRGAADGPRRYPAPGLHPELSLNIDGPLIERWPHYQLGLLSPDRPLRLALWIGNHCPVACQSEIDVQLDLPAGWTSSQTDRVQLPPLSVGRVEQVVWEIVPVACAAPTAIQLRVRSGRFEQQLAVHCPGCRPIAADEIDQAVITRYPGGRRSAFSWRGDFDLYDTASFQSIEGLEAAFGLSMRYALPQTMYLSTRLSLDQQAAQEWADHYQVSRGAVQIPEFVEWLTQQVDLRHSAAYPVRSDKRYVIELGNHGHLHYDTDASAAPGNDWLAGAKPGQGRYPWQGDDVSSLGDQRDNILEAARWCERLFGYRPRSWAKPGRGNDQHSPRAVEAAGCEVATGSDIRPRDNVLRQPRPHHPAGTSIVELTARYPSDPQHLQHLAMLLFWLHRGHRLGIPVVVLVHQHMRQFDGVACSRLTEFLLNRGVKHFNGDLYLDTVYAVGVYWLTVLSPTTRQVEIVLVQDGIEVSNRGTRSLVNLPLDIRLKSGQRLTRLIDLEPGQCVKVVP